jgi:RNA polymerase sigma factor (sigma-70 family)
LSQRRGKGRPGPVPPEDQDSLAALLADAQRRTDRFSRVFAKIDGYLASLFRQNFGNVGRDFIDEAVQETYLRLIEQLRHQRYEPRGEAAAWAWLRRIAFNIGVDLLRRERGCASLDALLAVGEPSFDPLDYREERLQQAAARMELILTAAGELSDTELDILLLHLSRRSNAEIARHCGLTYSAVATRLSRIRGKLRAARARLVAEQEPPEDQ